MILVLKWGKLEFDESGNSSSMRPQLWFVLWGPPDHRISSVFDGWEFLFKDCICLTNDYEFEPSLWAKRRLCVLDFPNNCILTQHIHPTSAEACLASPSLQPPFPRPRTRIPAIGDPNTGDPTSHFLPPPPHLHTGTARQWRVTSVDRTVAIISKPQTAQPSRTPYVTILLVHTLHVTPGP